jgi:hypothetical protein
MTTYAKLKTVDTKAQLVKNLIQVSQSRLNHGLIQAILGWEDTYAGGEKLDVSDVDPEIKILSAREFGEALRLQDYKMSHSWAGDKKRKEYGFLIVGNAEFGLAKNHSCYNNGNYSGGEEKVEDSNFELAKVQVVLINQEVSDHYNNRCSDENIWYLYIYLPESQLLDEETYELGRRFGFLGKFAEFAV